MEYAIQLKTGGVLKFTANIERRELPFASSWVLDAGAIKGRGIEEFHAQDAYRAIKIQAALGARKSRMSSMAFGHGFDHAVVLTLGRNKSFVLDAPYSRDDSTPISSYTGINKYGRYQEGVPLPSIWLDKAQGYYNPNAAHGRITTSVKSDLDLQAVADVINAIDFNDYEIIKAVK